MNAGLVTVVIPIYKTEKFLNRCIKSVVDQTYKNLEILLIDDGSPDYCPVMCDEWAEKDTRIRVIHKQNEGLGMARNTGIIHASGEYICFFDSDDYIACETIEKAYLRASEEKADIVIFGMTSVTQKGREVRKRIPDVPQCKYVGSEVQNVLLPDLIDGRHDKAMARRMALSACSCLFSMNLIKNAEWRFISEKRIISEDSYSLIQLYQYVEHVSILNEVLYFYCENATSLTRTYRSDRYDKLRQFYDSCMLMAREARYNEEVLKSISGLFVSMTIAAMKQLVVSNLRFSDKKKIVYQIIADNMLQAALEDVAYRRYGRTRNILLNAMRAKHCNICCLLLLAQNIIRK